MTLQADREAERHDVLLDKVARVTSRDRELDTEVGFGSVYGSWLGVALDLATAGSPDSVRYVPTLCLHQLQQRIASIAGPALLAQYKSQSVPYERFVNRIVETGWHSVFAQYPVLRRLIPLVTSQWVAATRDLAFRIDRDAAVLASAFGFDATNLAAVSGSLGDPHHGGRSVVGLKDHAGCRVAYKPRSVRPEVRYLAVLDHIASSAPDLRGDQPTVIEHDDYGWVSWVDGDQPCSEDQVDLFYRRAGAVLCASQVLGLSDLHLENLIACGATPTIIDLECLITPHFDSSQLAGDEGARRFFRDSVMPSGLLPGSIPSVGPVAADRVGLTGQGGNPTGSWGKGWVGLGTDDIDVVRRPMTVAKSANRPMPHRGKRPRPLVPTTALVRGYTQAVEALAASDFTPDELADCRPRVLFRATHRYVDVVGSLIKPESLADEARFESVVSGGSEWADAFDEIGVAEPDGRRWQEALVREERRSLRDLDVPAFTFDPTTGAVRLDGQEFQGIFRTRPLDDVARRLDGVVAGVDQQSDVIRISMQGHRVGTVQATDRDDVVGGPAMTTDEVRAVVRGMAAGLADSALIVDGRIRWLDADSVRGSSMLGPALTGGGLYNGAAGIGLTLALASAGFQSDRRAELAALAVRCVIDGYELLPKAEAVLDEWQLGSGFAGWAYAAAIVGSTLGEPALIARAADVVLPAVIEIGAEDNLDLINGWAGVVLAADAVATVSENHTLRSRVGQAADQIAVELQRREASSSVAPHRRLSMAHGAIGISLALRRAGAPGSIARRMAEDLTETGRVRTAERAGVPARVFRDDGRVRADTSWCWGTAGYAIANGGYTDNRATPIDQETVATALHHCERPGGEIDRLCCGSAGRLVALADHGSPAAQGLIRHLVDAWQTQTLVGDRSIDFVGPTLFRGLAGIAFALMSGIADIPNVLRLDPVS